MWHLGRLGAYTYTIADGVTQLRIATYAIGTGDAVGFQNSSGVLTCLIARNGSNIMSVAEDMTVNSLNMALTLQYASVARGWVFA